MSGKFLTRDQILSSEDLVTEEVRVPEWATADGADTVLVKALSGTQRDAYEASLLLNAGTKKQKVVTHNIRAKLVAWSIVDPDTLQPYFTQADVEKLGQKSGAALDRVFEVAQRLSKVTDADVEELAGNSGSDPSDDS